MVLGAQAPGRVGRRPFFPCRQGTGLTEAFPLSTVLFLDEPRLVRVARSELPAAAGEAIAHGLTPAL